MKTIEEYLEKPCWVIDILPRQVPSDSKGQYFAMERYWMKEPQYGQICQRFCRLLFGLNCYHNLLVYRADNDTWTSNPQPEELGKWLMDGINLWVVMEQEDAMITYFKDDLYLSLYNPSEPLLQLVRQLAASEGLFVRQGAVFE